MLRNSMGACAMMQLPRTPRAISPLRGPPGGGMATPPAGGGAPAGMFYPVTFATSTPRFVYTSSPVRGPFYPPTPQGYYEQPVGVAKRADQVRDKSSLAHQ